jgi:hypothetical protein
MEETEVTGETTDLSQFTDKSLSHNVVSSTPPHEQEYEPTTLVLSRQQSNQPPSERTWGRQIANMCSIY